RDTRGLPRSLTRTDTSGSDYGVTSLSRNDFGEVIELHAAENSDADPGPDSTIYVVDGYGRVIEVIDPVGVRLVVGLDAAGRVEHEEVLEEGERLSYGEFEYDAWDRVVRTLSDHLAIHPDGRVEVLDPPVLEAIFGYGAREHERLWTVLDRRVDSGGVNRLQRTAYDDLGRAVGEWIGPSNETGTEAVLDSMGRVLVRRIVHDREGRQGPANPSVSPWTFGYDRFGRPSFVRDPEGAESWRTYDAQGVVISALDPLSTRRTNEPDSAGRVLRAEERRGALRRAVSYEYDIEDRLLAIVDPEGHRTEFEYDTLGRLRRKRFADGTEVAFAYDRKDRLVRIEKAGGVTIVNRYDPADRRESCTASGAEADVLQAFAYDGLGQLSSAVDWVSTVPPVTTTVRRTHSSQGVLLAESFVEAGRSFSQVLNGAGELERLVYATGFEVEPRYDALGRLVELRRAGATIASFTSYGIGSYRRATFASGGVLEQEFDGCGRTLRRELWDGSLLRAGGAFSYDRAGSLVGRTRTWNDGLTAITRAELFGYDAFARLIRWDWDLDAGEVASRTVTWEHDLADNVVGLVDDGLEHSATVNELNQIEEYQPLYSDFEYSPNGEEIRRTSGAGHQTVTWDALGRPLRVSVPSGGGTQTLDFVHDALGRVVGRLDSQDEVTRYGYLGGTLLESWSSLEGVREIAYAYGEAIWRRRGGEELVIQTDPFGNVEALHDLAQGILEAYEYDPYGRVREALDPGGGPLTDSPLGNDLFFLSRPQHLALGLVQLDARLLDTGLGRFLERDPLGERASLNLYVYPCQNPWRWVDPTGLSPQDPSLPAQGLEVTEEGIRIVTAGTFGELMEKFIGGLREN
ncbi:MAG: RHS repeat-associated core domain-containing protein, partial [Planctomycetota bacterium]